MNVLFNYTANRVRRETAKLSHEDMLLVQSIQITDKFGFEKLQSKKNNSSSETVFIGSEIQGLCVNGLGKC